MLQSCSASRVSGGVVALLATAASLTVGCRAACDPSPDANTPEVFTAGVSAAGAYASGPWAGPHLHFPGGKRWNLEHRLGFVPRRVGVYLAIPAESRELTPCAGNTCVFCVDDQYVWLRNDTCAEFWVRVEADGQGPTSAATRCDEQAAPGGDGAVDSANDAAARDDGAVDSADGAAARDDGAVDSANDAAARDDATVDAAVNGAAERRDGSAVDGSLSEAALANEGNDAAAAAL